MKGCGLKAVGDAAGREGGVSKQPTLLALPPTIPLNSEGRYRAVMVAIQGTFSDEQRLYGGTSEEDCSPNAEAVAITALIRDQ